MRGSDSPCSYKGFDFEFECSTRFLNCRHLSPPSLIFISFFTSNFPFFNFPFFNFLTPNFFLSILHSQLCCNSCGFCCYAASFPPFLPTGILLLPSLCCFCFNLRWVDFIIAPKPLEYSHPFYPSLECF